MAPLLRPQGAKVTSKSVPMSKPKLVKVEGLPELIRLVSSLERLDEQYKVELGEIVFGRMEKDGASAHELWAVGRIGARVPFSGSEHACVSMEIAEQWIERLLKLEVKRPDELVFPLAQLARVSGDRARDLDAAVRERVATRLGVLKAPEVMVQMVREATVLGEREEQRVFGESLPLGLRLLGSAEQAG